MAIFCEATWSFADRFIKFIGRLAVAKVALLKFISKNNKTRSKEFILVGKLAT